MNELFALVTDEFNGTISIDYYNNRDIVAQQQADTQKYSSADYLTCEIYILDRPDTNWFWKDFIGRPQESSAYAKGISKTMLRTRIQVWRNNGFVVNVQKHF